MYQEWMNPPVPIYMKFYVFNVTNAEEFVNGGKPNLEENGPYTYRMLSPHFDVKFYSNHSISARTNHTLIYEPSMSNGDENDLLYHINMPLVTLSEMVKNNPPSLLSGFGIPSRLMAIIGDSDPIVQHTAKEIIFGYKDPMFNLFNQIMSLVGKRFDPIFGPFHNFNNSDDGLFLTNTGQGNFSLTNSIERWNGEKYLSYWSTSYANMINGTDGSFFEPNVKKSEPRYLFFSYMCRSSRLDYERDSQVKSVDTYRYHFAEDLFANASIQPNNIGFCVPEGNCFDSGVLNAAACRKGAPLLLSLPHLYLASEKYQNGLSGLKPNKTLHDSVFDIEPLTGASLYGRRNLQINIEVKPSDEFTKLKEVSAVMFPYFWLSGVAAANENIANKLRLSIILVNYANYISYLLILIGLLCLSKVFCKSGCKDGKGEEILVENEEVATG